jgi:hypothetical protein
MRPDFGESALTPKKAAVEVEGGWPKNRFCFGEWEAGARGFGAARQIVKNFAIFSSDLSRRSQFSLAATQGHR